MREKAAVDSTAEFEQTLHASAKEKYLLRLYVSGMTVKSVNAIENVKQVCERTLPGRYSLEVVDIRKNPGLAKEADVIVSVSDTGVGIADEVKPNIFVPLFTTKAKGQGLGLAVVKRLVEAQKGKISFES